MVGDVSGPSPHRPVDPVTTFGLTAAQAEFAARIAEGLVGVDKVDRTLAPSMGSEDFSSMLERRPGAYLLIGAGPTDGGRVLHGVRYDFNDEILDLGAQFWTKLVEEALPT